MTHFKLHTLLNIILISIATLGHAGEYDPVVDAIKARNAEGPAIDFHLRKSGDTLEFCLINVDETASQMDVMRHLLQLSEALKEEIFDEVALCYQDETRYFLTGKDFKVMGEEFGTQNPIYTVRTFAEKLHLPDEGRTNAFEERRGGLLYLMRVQMEDLRSAMGHWYLDQMLEEMQAKIDAQKPSEFAEEEDVF